MAHRKKRLINPRFQVGNKVRVKPGISDEECPLYGIGIDQEEEIEIPLEVIELKKDDPNYRLISDYTYWSDNWR